MTVRTSTGHVVATIDPPVAKLSATTATGMDAWYEADLPAGEYAVEVEVVGYGDPGVDGYTGYGSVGQYTLTVS